MKTTWRRKRNNLPVPGQALILILVFFIGWGAITAFKNLVPGIVERFVASTTEVGNASSSSALSFLSVFEDKSDLAAQVKRLENNEVALELQIQSLLYVQEENEELREVLQNTPTQGVLGSVVAWPPKTAYDSLIVEAKGVSVGDLVLGRGTVPIGTVSRLENGYAYVDLFTQGKRESQVRVGEEYLLFQLTGHGGGSAFIIAPSEAPIERGDQVFFPYNGNRLLGRIGSVEGDPASSTKRLWVVFPQHFFSYTWVSIVPYIES